MLAAVSVLSAAVRAQSCSRDEFETVVGEAATALRDLNLKNKPAYQGKLRQLKEKRGWSQETFLAEAAPLVQDEKIAAFDQRSSELLTRINTMGQEGTATAQPNCALLGELRRHMADLVTAQQEKWAYMFGRIDGELAK